MGCGKLAHERSPGTFISSIGEHRIATERGYISTMLEHNLVLKSGELYLVGNIATDGSRERATGLYLRDTRHLSTFLVKLNGQQPEVLSANAHDATHGAVVTANRLFRSPNDEVVLPLQILLEQTVKLDDNLRMSFTLQNFHRAPVELALEIEIASDFRDLFDVRGFPRAGRGKLTQPVIDGKSVTLGYVGLDGQTIQTIVAFDRDAQVSRKRLEAPVNEGVMPILPGTEELPFEAETFRLPEAFATFGISLEPQERWTLNVNVIPVPVAGPPVVGAIPDVGVPASVYTDNRMFNKVMARCRQDLEALQTAFPHGELPAAGIPWYVAPFGRDSLIAGLQTLPLLPDRAIGTLRVLASLQGTEIDEDREEEPGKVLHEMRYGEMARLCEVPHSPYFGSNDATPLWLMLFAESVAWTGSRELYEELLPNARLAVEWIERFGDVDGDGLVEYRGSAHTGGHITHQVWKDSYDSLNHADGSPAIGPVAAVEVQGYVFAAYRRLADVADAHGDEIWARDLRERAEAIRVLVEDQYWLPALEFYAQALDGDKQPVAVLSSNPGHLLMCGLPNRERAEQLTRRMLQPDLDSGQGLRTLSSLAPTYNPMSYHNGSIWPHDNSMIAAGFYRYRDRESGHALATAMFDVAQEQALLRLPELYCGFGRDGNYGGAPIPYPVSCSPQAWAAGAVPHLVCTMLGLEIDVAAGKLTLSPSLPKWLDELTISDLSVLGSRGTLSVRRQGSGYAIETVSLPV
jgi:glycogen debranching enzyme